MPSWLLPRTGSQRTSPATACARVALSAVVRMGSGETVELDVHAHLTADGLEVSGHIDVDGSPVFTRTWCAVPPTS